MSIYDYNDPEEVFDHPDDFDSQEEMYEAYDELMDDLAERQRRERNSSSSSRGGNRTSSEGCYIATAVYGSYDCPEVWVLRRFRDFGLRKSRLGAAVVQIYYWISPKLVRKFGDNEKLCGLVRRVLNRFVDKLKQDGYSDIRYRD